MKTSRQRLLEFVYARKIVSAGELSRALQMTEANARHHLAILQEQGLVEVVGERPPQGKGRPAQLFGPSKQARGNNLAGLAKALLAEMADEGWAVRVARRMAAEEEAPLPLPASSARLPEGGGHLTQRLVQTVQRLNELHYQARWEAHAGGPRLILRNCPYAEIIEKRPELCQVDAALLEQLAGAPVEQIAKLAPERGGGAVCVFRM